MEKLIIFDCDGVLRWFSWEEIYKVYEIIGDEINIDIRSFFKSGYRLTHDWHQTFYDFGIRSDFEIEMAKNIFRKQYFSKVYTFQWVQETLRKLYREGYHIGVFSNSLEDTLRKSLSSVLDIVSIVGSESVNHLKPHPDGIQILMEMFHARPQHTIMVGDADIDILAGKNAGTKTALVTWGATTDSAEIDAINPDVVVTNHKQLCPDFFQQFI